MSQIHRCRVCDSLNLDLAVNLGHQPWCNDFLTPEQVGKEKVYPLRVVFCCDCRTAQLDYTIPKEVMFGNHTYVSGTTSTLSAHFADVAREVDEQFFRGERRKSVLDIGSNDGTQLVHYQSLGYDALGVEPCERVAKMARAKDIPTLEKFFNWEVARELSQKFNVINASGVLFHLEELHSACEGISECLRDDGVFVVQFLYLKRIIENCAFDQIYHEHLLYYNLATLDGLLRRHGMEIFDARNSPIHGGSVIAFASHVGSKQKSDRLQVMLSCEERDGINSLDTLLRFDARIEHLWKRDSDLLDGIRANGKVAFGLGAPAKGNTLLNLFKFGVDHIRCLVDRNPLRRGLFSPGMHIPVLMEDEVDDPPDLYYVLAWNFKEEILNRYQSLIERGVQFYFPINPEN
jgi:SAM-dependent methyltransferase